MKAILILDMPDDLKKSHADITIHEDKGEHRIIKRIAELKPLPSKKDWKIGYVKDNNTCEIFNKNYVDGWNDCISEILGEEK